MYLHKDTDNFVEEKYLNRIDVHPSTLWKNSKEYLEKSFEELGRGNYCMALKTAFEAMQMAIRTMFSQEIETKHSTIDSLVKRYAEEGRLDYEWFTLYNALQTTCKNKKIPSKEKTKIALDAVREFINHVEHSLKFNRCKKV